jgi:hypothetical protein
LPMATFGPRSLLCTSPRRAPDAIPASRRWRRTGSPRTGMAIAKDTLKAGQDALHEKDVRGYGLAVSVVLIAFAMLAIRSLIRRIEGNQVPDSPKSL